MISDNELSLLKQTSIITCPSSVATVICVLSNNVGSTNIICHYMICSISSSVFSRRRTASTTSLHWSSSVWKMESTQMAKVSLSLSGYHPAQRTKVPCGRWGWPVNGCSGLSLLPQCGLGCNEPVEEPLNHQLLPALITPWECVNSFQTAHTFRAANQEARGNGCRASDVTSSHSQFINRSCRLLCWFL